jgi:hypothetical protein
MIHRRVEQRTGLIGRTADLKPRQFLFPLRVKILLHSLKIPSGDFAPEIFTSLFDADE